MRINPNQMLMAALICAWVSTPVHAEGIGSSAGKTLTRPPAARPAALGSAFSAMPNDISSLAYNPALLGTLKDSQASFLYQKGLYDDAYGNFLLGLPTHKGGFGLGVSYYDAGNLEMADGRKIKLMTDFSGTLGYSQRMGMLSLGGNLKAISSRLAEATKATAVAGDLGMSLNMNPRFTVGAAVQNIGSNLTYENKSDHLDRLARLGFSWLAIQSKVNLTVLADAPYHLVDKDLQPGAGIELGMGPMALRAGYKQGDLAQFTFGAGFNLNAVTFDYAFGLADTLDSTHLASVSFRFGSEPKNSEAKRAAPQTSTKIEAKQVVPKNQSKTEAKRAAPKTPTAQNIPPLQNTHVLFELMPPGALPQQNSHIYEVRRGDTLKSIARRRLGSENLWKIIYNANRHLALDPNNLEVGQKLVIP